MEMGIIVAGLFVFVAGILLAAGIAIATGWHATPLVWICFFCGAIIALAPLLVHS